MNAILILTIVLKQHQHASIMKEAIYVVAIKVTPAMERHVLVRLVYIIYSDCSMVFDI